MSTSPPTKTVRHKRSRSQEIVTHHDVPNLLRVSGVITAHPQSNVGDNVAYYSDVDEDMIMGGHFDEDASSGSAVLATRVFSDPACQNTLREAFSDPESNSDVGRSFSKEEMIFSKDDASTEGTSSGDGSEKPSRDPRDFMKKVATSIRRCSDCGDTMTVASCVSMQRTIVMAVHSRVTHIYRRQPGVVTGRRFAQRRRRL